MTEGSLCVRKDVVNVLLALHLRQRVHLCLEYYCIPTYLSATVPVRMSGIRSSAISLRDQ